MSVSVFTHSSSEVSKAIKQPCRQDCENRCAGCHAKCEEYLAYQEYKRTVYAARAKTTAMIGPTPGKQARLREAAKQKRNGYRHKR